MLEIGSIVDGKYKILNQIGKGGMSVVYLAMNERANKQWAIKEVRKDGVQNFETVRQNLIAETDILKKLNHENLPSIIDVIDCDDTFLIVMDYIEGRPLSDLLKESGAQPQEKVIDWAKQICDVLSYLHSREKPIIYRDLKPSNLMLKPDSSRPYDKIMIIDFGTAREFKGTQVEDTTCLGTQGYAAPEQFGGHGETDARTDIYCFGATIYHLLTGHNPAMPPYEMYPITYWNPSLSTGLEDIILKCTRKDPNERYQNCAELMYALEHYDELDREYKKRQTRKWRAFLAGGAMTVVCAVACTGFKFAENSKISQSYEGYLREASTASTQAEAYENYRNAINLNPGEGTAWLSLLDTFVQPADGETEQNFSQEEADQITELRKYKGTGSRENQSYLEGDEAAYSEFAFQLGIDYFYYYNGMGNKPLSQSWFEIAKDSTTLDEGKRQCAEYFEKIASYYAQLNTEDKSGYSSVSFSDYWSDLDALSQGDLVEKTGSNMTALAIYEQVIGEIQSRTLDFKNAHVDSAALTGKLQAIESSLDQVEDSGGKIEELKTEIQSARDMVSKVYGG